MNKDIESKLYLFMTKEEEREYFETTCDKIIANPRYYLDNLENLNVFTVSFNNYRKRKVKKAKVYK
jgi:hypothetical protein